MNRLVRQASNKCTFCDIESNDIKNINGINLCNECLSGYENGDLEIKDGKLQYNEEYKNKMEHLFRKKISENKRKILKKKASVTSEVKSAYEAKGFGYDTTGFASDCYTMLKDDVSFCVTSQATYEAPVDLDRPIEVTINYGMDLGENVELKFNSSIDFLNNFDEVLKEYKEKAEIYNDEIMK